jgi:hypothetical protein
VHIDREALAKHAARITYPMGRVWITVRPSPAMWLRPARSTRLMSSGDTARPPSATEAEQVSLFRRPAETLTMSDPTVTPAIFSAASTA